MDKITYYKHCRGKPLQKEYKFDKFKEIMDHNEYLKKKHEFEDKLRDPKNNYLMSYYKSSYDGSIKEAIPYLRKAYYDQRKKSL